MGRQKGGKGKVAKIKPKGYWTRERCLSEIRRLYDEGFDISASNIKKEYGSLFTKTLQKVGKWSEALEICGIDVDEVYKCKPNNYWNKQRAIEEIQKINEVCDDMSGVNIVKNYSEIYSTAIKLFGNWAEACNHSGIDIEKHRKKKPNNFWDETTIKERIDEIVSAKGNLTIEFIKRDGQGLYNAARRIYGSWELATISLGLEYRTLVNGNSDSIECGRAFEMVATKIIKTAGFNYKTKVRLPNNTIPDLIDENGKIFDIKLSNYSDWGGIETKEKYGSYSDGVGIIFLRGDFESTDYIFNEVNFRHISYYTESMSPLNKEFFEDMLKTLS